MIACAIDAEATTIVRVKSAGTMDCVVTACRTVPLGIDAMSGPKGEKTAGKLSAMLDKLGDEPLAISLSPASILTLPAWFPAQATHEQKKSFGRIEAGFFLKRIEEWAWHTMPLRSGSDHPADLEGQIIMFYPALHARSIDEELGKKHRITSSGLHIEPIVRLTAGRDEPMAVLELEKEYTAFFVSRNGCAEYFRYWPVKNENEREFFALRELEASPADIVRVTGLRADARTVKRISDGSARRLLPLSLPFKASLAGEAGSCPESTGFIRAVSTAMMALAEKTE
jgi:hypothetical protein